MSRVCEKCKVGRLCVRSSVRKGTLQVRYMQCNKCDHKTRATVPSSECLRRT